MKNTSIWVFITCLAWVGCINVTMHNQMKGRFGQFFVDTEKDCPDGAFCLVETDAKELLNEMAKSDKPTWVHVWKPWCHGTLCKPIGVYQKLAERHPNINFYLISQNYDYQRIKNTKQQQQFAPNIFVLKHATYGIGMDKARKRFLTEMFGNAQPDSVYQELHYIFSKDEKLAYSGNEISDEILNQFSK